MVSPYISSEFLLPLRAMGLLLAVIIFLLSFASSSSFFPSSDTLLTACLLLSSHLPHSSPIPSNSLISPDPSPSFPPSSLQDVWLKTSSTRSLTGRVASGASTPHQEHLHSHTPT